MTNKQYSTQTVPILTYSINLSVDEGRVPPEMKRALVRPPTDKKPGLDHDELKNYRPVCNLSFLSKQLEGVVAARLRDHLTLNGIGEQFQSAYQSLPVQKRLWCESIMTS